MLDVPLMLLDMCGEDRRTSGEIGTPIILEPLENGTPTQTTPRNQLTVKTAVSAKWQRLRPFDHLSQKYNVHELCLYI